uniref:Uncharacterized protein n=1 Tax=viral metagenome TaxID=1070528 RepID=A0A6M3JUI7_9ZZZZ
MAGWHDTALVNVYPTTALPGAGTRDLDLSAIVGAQRCLVFLKITCTNTSPIVAIREKDDPDNWIGTYSDSGHGSSHAIPAGAVSQSVGIVATTNADGVVEWQNTGTPTIRIDLIGWLDSTYSGATVYGPAAAPAAWTDLDMSAIVSAKPTLVFLKTTMTGGASEVIATRPDGDVDDWFDQGTEFKGCSQGRPRVVGNAQGYLVKTDAFGVIEHVSLTGGISYRTDLLHYENTGGEFVDCNFQVFASAAPPAAYTDLDLTQDTGANPTGITGRSLCLLKLTRTKVAGGLKIVSFRTNGDADNWQGNSFTLSAGASSTSLTDGETTGIVVATDASGKIEWKASAVTDNFEVELIGYVPMLPPVISAELPVGIAELPDVAVSFLTADETGVVEASIDLDLTDPSLAVHNAIIGGAFQPGYSGTITAVGLGFQVTLTGHPPFVNGQWLASAYCEDTDGQGTGSNWFFTVVWTTPPSVIYTHPVEFTPDVDQIRFSVVDIYGLDTSSLSLSAVLTGDGEKTTHVGIIATVPQLGWDVTIVESDYTGVIPRRIDVVIRDWPMDLSVVYRRVEMVVDITSFVGVPL